ncbi:cyclin-domain-containing protein [Coniochaeta ligniaria NRRL 30616]|uniref:Cyclin-domain-containing protein n=1 Tax=Coniochaeta ligniaria NRRL 30616 TaxID=1408157 RepID=A0A1J7IZ90_9PEZI|nr:cyclin-domain-containing protein [Coniochaeta ligniaria NRRL 30616]
MGDTTLATHAKPVVPGVGRFEVIGVPREYEFCDVNHVVLLVSDLFTETSAINTLALPQMAGMTLFHSFSVPRIPVHAYVARLTKYALLQPALLLSVVYYMDRLSALYPRFILCARTVHRFLIAAVTVAAKGLSDKFWSIRHYARVGGITPAELVLLERELLVRVEWRVVPDPDLLLAYYHGLVDRSRRFKLVR